MPLPEPGIHFNAMFGTPVLDMSHNRLGPGELLEDVLERVPDVERLDLSNTDLSDLWPLKDLKHLRVLYLLNTEVKDLTPIANITTLEILIISDTPVDDLEPLEDLPNLSWLAMERNSVDSLWPLSHIKSLRILDLGGALIYTNDLSPLHSLDQLERVDARSTHIPLSELRRLREALPNCNVLSHVMPEPGDFTNQDDYEEAVRNATTADQPAYAPRPSLWDWGDRDDDFLDQLPVRAEPELKKEEPKIQQMPKAGEPRRKLKR